MRGSWSLKEVLPTVVPSSATATLTRSTRAPRRSLVYEEAIDPRTSKERHDEIRRHLLAYCKRDTWAMVKLVEALTS